MRISELKTDEEEAILCVKGSGVFRHRIIRMGFVKGKNIKFINNAPLKDPIEYNIMRYHVSLRRSEAELVEIVTIDGSSGNKISNNNPLNTVSDRQFLSLRKKTIDVAFIENPNSGKTSIFYFASYSNEHTGNYSGVTVDSETARLFRGGYLFNITDFPGTYSLSTFSPEELFVRDFIIDEVPDIIVNVIDVQILSATYILLRSLSI
jgi:ferrous iron transport protein B